MSKRLSYGINVIRITACLMVFMLHSTIFEPEIDMLLENKNLFFLYPSAWAGVWIFFITGGYLAGLTFQTKYEVSLNGVFCYYSRRIKRTIIPTVCFIILCYLLVYPMLIKDLPEVLFRFFTFQYKGTPGANGVGATWYVSTLLFFYLISPAIIAAVKFIRKYSEKAIILLFVLLVLFGAVSRYIAFINDMNWNDVVYTPWYFNIDLYVGGVLLAYFPNVRIIKNGKCISYISYILFFLTILMNAYLQRKMRYGGLRSRYVCCYLFQTVYLIIVAIFIRSNQVGKEDLNDYPGAKIIKSFANISFEFYLFHSLVLQIWSEILRNYIKIDSFWKHIAFLIIIGLITIILSLGYHRIFIYKNTKKEILH